MQGAAENMNHSAVRNVTRPPVIITNLVPGLIYEFKVVTPSMSMLKAYQKTPVYIFAFVHFSLPDSCKN